MAYEQRKGWIARLEQSSGSRVRRYMLSDRESFPSEVPRLSSLEIVN
jgi:hypothetical protein